MKYKYYKGEEENPYALTDHKKSVFWTLEENFDRSVKENPHFIDSFKEETVLYIKEHPNENNILTDKSVDMDTKIFIAYADNMLGKWCPYEPDLILDY